MENEASLPRPIDNGQVDQTVVEYTGGQRGAVTYRGPSGRSYRFDAGPSNKRHYVLDEDLEYFRRLVDFRVLEETRIDLEEEKLRTLVAEAVERQKAKTATAIGRASEADEEPEAARRASKRGGRPAGRGFGAWLDCLMMCGNVQECYGTAQETYDAIYEYLIEHTKAGEHVPRRGRFPSLRSDAKRKRQRAGRCVWHRHPEPVPEELLRP
jgi:hypothetical protein